MSSPYPYDTNDQSSYGAASPRRAEALESVAVRSGTAARAIIYFDGKAVHTSRVYRSGEDARGTRYQYPRRRHKKNQSMRMSKDDAETMMYHEQYKKAKELKANMRRRGERLPKSIRVDVVTNNPTCGDEKIHLSPDKNKSKGMTEDEDVNGCKLRGEYFKEDMIEEFPSTESKSHPGEFHVTIALHYDKFVGGPTREARPGLEGTIRYGHEDAQPRESDYTRDHPELFAPDVPTGYYSAYSGSGLPNSIYTTPGNIPLSDRWSPTLTPSPPESHNSRTPSPPGQTEAVSAVSDQFAGMSVNYSDWTPAATSQYPNSAAEADPLQQPAAPASSAHAAMGMSYAAAAGTGLPQPSAPYPSQHDNATLSEAAGQSTPEAHNRKSSNEKETKPAKHESRNRRHKRRGPK
nr:hypothetical protein [Kibdelosporangium sp. MJ126-NF4]